MKNLFLFTLCFFSYSTANAYVDYSDPCVTDPMLFGCDEQKNKYKTMDIKFDSHIPSAPNENKGTADFKTTPGKTPFEDGVDSFVPTPGGTDFSAGGLDFKAEEKVIQKDAKEASKSGKKPAAASKVAKKKAKARAVASARKKNEEDNIVDEADIAEGEGSGENITYQGLEGLDLSCANISDTDPSVTRKIPSIDQMMKIQLEGKEAHVYKKVGCRSFYADDSFSALKSEFTQDDRIKVCGHYRDIYCHGQEFKTCFKTHTESDVRRALTQDFLVGCNGLNKAAKYNRDVTEREQNGCVLVKKYTLDFKSCVRAVDHTQYAIAGSQVGELGVGVAHVKKQGDIQSDVATASVGAGNAQGAALEAQKKSFQNDARSSNLRAGVKGTSGGVMLHSIAGYPTLKNLPKKSGKFGMDPREARALAKMAETDGDLQFELFANKKVKEQVREMGMANLMDGLFQAVVAAMQKKRAKSVANVQKALEDATFNNPENQFDLGPTYCEQNPTVPACSNGGSRRAIRSKPTISFGSIGAQGGGNIQVGNGELEEGGANVNGATRPSQELIDNLDDIVGHGNNSTGNNDFKKVGAANVTAGSSGGGGGGGGGGGSAGGGGGGPGGGAPGKKEAPSSGVGAKAAGKYATGGTMRFAQGGRVKKKSNGDSPFANMFKKKRHRAIASQGDKNLLPKESKIFQALSDRYKAIDLDGRLAKTSDE